MVLHLALAFQTLAVVLLANAAHSSKPEPDPSSAVSVSLNGKTFINKGLVAFGLIPSNILDSKGDSIGGIGSAMTIKFGTYKAKHGNKFIGTFAMQPDRGFNVNGTVDYQARRFDIDFELNPYYNTANLSFTDAQKTLKLSHIRTTVEFERDNKKTTGFDATAVRPVQANFPQDPKADPETPIASANFPHLSLDVEGIVSLSDGTFWISDEYGPYIYHYTSNGCLIQVIQPPPAILPRDANGALNFTASKNPTTGRQANQGFEGLTFDPATDTLYAMLQSPTIQDGGGGPGRYTRILAYDIHESDKKRPHLTGEWVIPLPLSSSGKVLGASDVHFVNKNLFLALSRDGNGRGGNDAESGYKQADLVDVSSATDIHNTKFDDPANPIAPGGVLDPTITPATYVSFVNYLNGTQLARFGLHNGKPDDQTLIDGKWESLVLAPVYDRDFPDDYFLFTAADNDFISTQGVLNGVPFNAGLDSDNQFLVFRLTLPTVPRGSIADAIGAKNEDKDED